MLWFKWREFKVFDQIIELTSGEVLPIKASDELEAPYQSEDVYYYAT